MNTKEQLTGRLIGFAKDCIVGGYPSQILADELAKAILSQHTAAVAREVNEVLDAVEEALNQFQPGDSKLECTQKHLAAGENKIIALRRAYPLTKPE